MLDVEIKQLENSEIEIKGEVSAEEFMAHRKGAVEKLGKDLEVSGFRKGHAPEEVVARKVGEEALLYEMAERAFFDLYPKILKEKNIEALGRPQITITKIAKDNPLGFRIRTAVMPEIKLPDYKAIAEEALKEPMEEVVVTDEELEGTINEIRKNFAEHERAQKKKEGGGAESHGNVILGADGAPISGEEEKKADDEPPDLTDDFVKKLGRFDGVDDFRKKIRENLRHEKEAKEREKRRIKLLEALTEKFDMAVPKPLIELELERMINQMKDQAAMAGFKPEEYLKQIGKSEDDMKKEWNDDAKKRVKTQVILSKIAENEKISVPKEDLDREVKKITAHYPDAPEERARAYVENMMTNERTLRFLEEPPQEGKPEEPQQ